ncbi:MAG: homoserine dehydrogenase [Pseudomonadota bacterium]
MSPLRLGLLGLGTVGQGVISILGEHSGLLEERAGRPLTLTRVASRSAKPEVDLLGASFGTDPAALVQADDVDVVVECIGGEQPCLDLLTAALGRSKSVVTANKALIATHGDALHQLASSSGAGLAYEAAVAGGIPILKAITEGLVANRIEWLAGIINGTSNYILTAMAEQGQDFSSALATAQELGYAEADPTFDVEGIDAAHKLAILAGLAFGRCFDFAGVATEGISGIAPIDIEYAARLGYVIKHLGIARFADGAVETSVHPALVPEGAPLAQIKGVTNAVQVGADALGSTLYTGPGAGMLPTASAVLADVVDLARGAPPPRRLAAAAAPMAADDRETPFYLRLQAQDRPGVFARITTLLSNAEINIDAALQQEHDASTPGTTVPIVLLTRPTTRPQLQSALEQLEGLADQVDDVQVLRVESLKP